MNILAFGIHPDDIELGCGGAVALAVADGHAVTLVDLTDGSASSNGTVDERAAEAKNAAKILGVHKRLNLGIADAAVQSEDPAQTASVVRVLREQRPQLVLLPSSDDPHPDHASGGALIERALYLCGVHGYQSDVAAWRVANALIYPGRNDIGADVIVDVSDVHKRKLEAMRAHVTQFGAKKGRHSTPLNDPEFEAAIEARARLYGQRIGVRFGEPFRLLRPLSVTDFNIFAP